MKPLGCKNYGSIPHLIGSKLGPADRHVHEGQHRICTERVRDRHDVIVIQEKYDGSNVGVARKSGKILALTQAGYLAHTSPYEQHHVFSAWVKQNQKAFDDVLEEGERIIGEWLYQAHGLKYKLAGSPFIAFDLFLPSNERLTTKNFQNRVDHKIRRVQSWFSHGQSVTIEDAFNTIQRWRVGPISGNPEGVVYRVERKGKIDFLAKYVRNDFEPGRYLPEISGNPPVYNCLLDEILRKQ